VDLLAAAVEAEAASWIDGHASVVDAKGRRQVVRNGFMPERVVITGIGPVKVIAAYARIGLLSSHSPSAHGTAEYIGPARRSSAQVGDSRRSSRPPTDCPGGLQTHRTQGASGGILPP
jgi:hypothetical protein